MNNQTWIEAVEHARMGDDKLFSKVVSSNFRQHFYTPILLLTKDRSIVDEIYILSITKFWERFVLMGEELPSSNINGYIFKMARNAFFEMKRKQNTIKASSIVSVDAVDIFERYSDHLQEDQLYMDTTPVESSKDVQLKAVIQAVNQLNPLCKQIIEKNILESNSLKTIKEELELGGTYNSIVQKKKRCIKRLRKLLTTKFSTNSPSIEMKTYGI